MSRPQLRADFTVKGANAAALIDQANAQANALAGVGYTAEVLSLHIQEDMRVQPGGEVIGWRADVEAALRPVPDTAEEPF